MNATELINEYNKGRREFLGASLYGANLVRANLYGADLYGASLYEANLTGANLVRANLTGASLNGANLYGADLSGSKGLLTASQWMRGFYSDPDRGGWIVYKAIGDTIYTSPSTWTIEPGAILEEVVNPTRTQDCGCGVNFATLAWCEDTYPKSVIWECLLHFEDAPDICVPYNTDGKARCGRLELIRIVEGTND